MAASCSALPVLPAEPIAVPDPGPDPRVPLQHAGDSAGSPHPARGLGSGFAGPDRACEDTVHTDSALEMEPGSSVEQPLGKPAGLLTLKNEFPPAAPDAPSASYRSALNHWVPPNGRSGTDEEPVVWSRPALSSGAAWLLIDLVLWTGAFFACAGIFKLCGIPLFLPNPRILAVPLLISLFAGWLVGAYDRDTTFVSLAFATESLIAGMLATVVGPGLVALFGSYGGAFQPSRLFLFVVPAAFAVSGLLVRRRLWRAFGGTYSERRVVLIGTRGEAASVEAALRLTQRPMEVRCISPELAVNGGLEAMLDSPPGAEGGVKLPRNLNSMVVIAPSAAGRAIGAIKPLLVALHSSSVPVYSWSAFWNQRVRMYDCNSDCVEWLFDKDFQMSASSVYWHVKRMTDIAVALLGIVLTSPVLAAAAIAIRLESHGGILFRQQRVGLRGNLFTIIKFRTMKDGSDAEGTTTSQNDPRVTRIGNFLRKYRIDEIPQLFNVLRGEMSIVGPRPEWTACVDRYEHAIPGYHLRHLVKPGITGWAQVNFPYGEDVEDAKTKLAFDLHYVTHASLVLDTSIILKTIYVLAGRVGGQ